MQVNIFDDIILIITFIPHTLSGCPCNGVLGVFRYFGSHARAHPTYLALPPPSTAPEGCCFSRAIGEEVGCLVPQLSLTSS